MASAPTTTTTPAQPAAPTTPPTTASPPPESEGGNEGGKREPPYAAYVVIAGLIAIVAVFMVASTKYGKASDVATATAGVSGVIAALVGAYFGIRGSSLTQKQLKE
jgi:hypothetical protein